MTQLKDDLQVRWWNLEAKLVERFGKKPDVETVLFLIGIQELGQPTEKFTKEQKQDLMHIAVCTLLCQLGYYEFVGRDNDGWPHFNELKSVPVTGMAEQERMLKECIIRYFE